MASVYESLSGQQLSLVPLRLPDRALLYILGGKSAA